METSLRHVGAVDRNILGITIDSGRTVPSTIEPYVREEGDEAEIPSKRGQLPNGDVQTVYLRREGKRVGWLVGDDNDHVTWFEKLDGSLPDADLASEPANWSIRSKDDPAYRQARQPVTVWRKQKPIDWVRADRTLVKAPTRITFYLVLPAPLVEGMTYTITTGREMPLLTSPLVYVHDPLVVRSEAVHTIHTGYRFDDPGKRAYFSVWLGDGGGHAFPDGLTFRVCEAETGQSVHTGQVQRAWPAEKVEAMGRQVNYNETDVGYIDFPELDAPGTYRVVVDGIGCSHTFVVAEDAWAVAFRTSMLGFLHQRAGLELGPPLTQYVRPLNLHPSVATIWQSTLRQGEGDLQALAMAKTDERVEAWGGYQDAGDFDSHTGHLIASRFHMTLLELFPELGGLTLQIPEAVGETPDLLDEALWNVMLYRRLQRADGAISHGIEASAHPRAGEPSWITSLTLVAFAPDASSSYQYAASAAQVANLLPGHAAERAKDLEASARHAFAWAEREVGTDASDDPARTAARNLAACALYKVTAEKAFHDVFEATTLFKVSRSSTRDGPNRQDEAAFAYARLPVEAADQVLQANCRAAIFAAAEEEGRGAAGNAFNITHPIASMPLILGRFSTPQALHSCWAHWLTGERKYLETAVRSSHFGLGANPMNITLTSGLGHQHPLHPLHLDSRNTGQPVPAGITVYGNNDIGLGEGSSDWLTWPFRWFFDKQCFPSGSQWPVTESYFDVFGAPSMNEFTIHQTMALASFVWGYLATRS